MNESKVMMPDGTLFDFWDDTTNYSKTYYVACEHPEASDSNPGSIEKPFATIGAAAAVLQPGEKVIVHGGSYRECVRPASGGDGPDSMIAYEAAPGEEVRITGSMIWQPATLKSEGWKIGWAEEVEGILMADLPAEWFVGYNPFIANNMSAEFTTFTSDWSNDEKLRMQLRRGMIFCNGKPLQQVSRIKNIADHDGAFWVDDPGLRIHYRLPGSAAPESVKLEVTTREQVFAPLERGLGWIRVSGFVMDHAADGVPVPQRAMLSTARGHHWIIENNTIRWANSTGIDIGNESWLADARADGQPVGGHIVRRNHVSDCGVCGIAGVIHVDGTLVEDNIVERIGGMNIERIWETGGLKFHICKGVLLRRNIFRHIIHAPGVWLDYLNENCRVTENVFADIQALNGGIYLEVSHDLNLIDNNIFWDIRRDGTNPHHIGGLGANIDSGEKCIVTHNLFANIPDNYAVSCHLGQADRVVAGRNGLCRNHKVMNNIFANCPKRIHFARAESNLSDGNLFDCRNDFTSFCIQYPAPNTLVNLSAWQEHFGFDINSKQAIVDVAFDPEVGTLSLTLADRLPEVMAQYVKPRGELSVVIDSEPPVNVNEELPDGVIEQTGFSGPGEFIDGKLKMLFNQRRRG